MTDETNDNNALAAMAGEMKKAEETHPAEMRTAEISIPIGEKIVSGKMLVPAGDEAAVIDYLRRKGRSFIMTKLAPEAWQPIETAPRDGSYFIFCTSEDYVATAQFIRGSYFCFAMNEEGLDIANMDATHWMPLPAPPKT